MSDVVLIHSTGQGAAGWERVVHALTERGQFTHAVELPSDPDLLAADYAELIRRQVGAIATPVVLAHSGAGPLLPATACALGARRQVWLAAWVPDPEASFVEDTNRHAEADFHPDWIGKDPTEDDAASVSSSTGWRRSRSTRVQSAPGATSWVGSGMPEFFPYAVDIRLAPFWLPFGFRPGKDGVRLTDDGTFRATFGFLRVETPLANIDEAHVTRNYRWWTAAGARGSLADGGLTFGTNRDAGVCVHFREPVPSPYRRKGHPALTVTVADVDGLVNRLRR